MGTKETELTIAERLAALKLFDEFKGGISQLAAIIDDTKACVIAEEEWLKAELKKTPNADGKNETWNWTDEGSEKVVKFSKEGVDYLSGRIKAKSEANELTLADKAIISLNTKLQ